jgi:urease accessory protein
MDDDSQGKGEIVLGRLGPDRQVLSTLSFQYPLKLISPRLPGQPCTSVFIMSYGGGLVGGDQIHLSANVQVDSKLSLLTQGSTKIFKQRDTNTSKLTTQSLHVKVDRGGLLALLPDPIQPFSDSCYEQYQSFELHPEADLILLDWVNSGRPARGETWTLTSFRSRNDIFIRPISQHEQRRLLLRDTLILDTEIAKSMAPFECFATLILRGPSLSNFSKGVVERFKIEERVRRPSAHRPVLSNGKATWTAGIVRDGCCVVKVAGETGEMVKEFLNGLLVVDEMVELIGREALRAVL